MRDVGGRRRKRILEADEQNEGDVFVARLKAFVSAESSCSSRSGAGTPFSETADAPPAGTC
jgi:hypothetical protein